MPFDVEHFPWSWHPDLGSPNPIVGDEYLFYARG